MAKRAKTMLAGMDVQGLLDLREQVDKALSGFRSTLERQLESLGGAITSVAKRGSLKGMKVAPKFKGPSGELWAGRGATPRWLTALLKEGRKLEDFAIEKTVGKAKKATKRRTKKGRKSKR